MNEEPVFGLEGTPWRATDIRFDPQARRLNIDRNVPPSSHLAHSDTGQPSPVHDTLQRTWRHLNFFQFECDVNAFVPRVGGGPDGGGVKQVQVPWARPQSGFTLLMESLLVLCARTGMTVAELGRMLGEHAQRCWNVLLHHVERAHATIEVQEVKTIRRDDYLTVMNPLRAGASVIALVGREILRASGPDHTPIRCSMTI